VSLCSLGAVLVSAATAAAAPQLDVYAGDVPRDQLGKIAELGIDRHEIELSKAHGASGAKNEVHVETIMSADQASALAAEGIAMAPKEMGGQTVAERATLEAADGFEVFKRYSGPGGLKEEFIRTAARNWRIAKLVKFGKSVKGEDLIALKLSKGALWRRDGSKPAVLYLGAQHAREWITPEMVRRLMHYFVDNYDTDKQIRRLVDKNELWFVPVANPDGYDWTFEPGQRLWRKNLRDNNGNGTIEPGDGVDLNRNLAYKWGYDNEGSSPDPASETYRGPGPTSEPESKAIDALARRVGFEFFVNYHSAAELLLYGTGWQVSTPTPDDVIAEALAGDDANPAVPGYDPDISAELYTTNGDTDTHMTERYGVFGFTPEMSTCEAASNSVPDDEWEAADCGSGFEFPDDEELVQAEFEKNIPFALSIARSADDPDDPESALGHEVEDFRVDSFDVSYGDPQTVAVVAKRALKHLRMHYRINHGKTRTTDVREWRGGERYGDENDRYYAEFRGEVRGADPGDQVKVWFSAVKRGKHWWHGRDVESESFAYTVKGDTNAQVLVLANEDYNGVNPPFSETPAGGGLKYAQTHLNAIRAAGYGADLWDVDAQGVPHDLGVLSHYKAIVWYMGDNRITQDPEDLLISTPFGQLADIGVAERQQYLTLAVRDFLNAGGKLIHAAETAQYSGLPGISDVVGGLFYGLDGDPSAECVITTVPGFFEDCLILADDFRQYYLGAFTRVSLTAAPDSVSGIAPPIEGYEGALAGTPSNPLDESGLFQATSEVLPPAQFPQFTSRGAAELEFEGNPFAPVEGSEFAGALHQDTSYMRLTRTIDLSEVPAADQPRLQFALSINTEPSYDNVIVEAHTPGEDNWTTLADLNGGTQTNPPAECTSTGFLLALHPFLRHYLGGADCRAAGTSGVWNSFTGSLPDGWHQAAVDLSAYAGEQVEVSIAYVTDPGGGGIGAFLDDTRLVTNAGTLFTDGFEGETGWAVAAAPPGSPQNAGQWEIGLEPLEFFAGTSTNDTLLLGFGLEQVATDADRTTLVRQALEGLGVRRW
jgi:hypothetical protein